MSEIIEFQSPLGTSGTLRQAVRIAEALIFAAPEPIDQAQLTERLPQGVEVTEVLRELKAIYANRGINLVKLGGRWSFRTAEDLAHVLRRDAVDQRRLSRAALETLAIIAYHQPVTRADIEEIRGVSTSKGTLDVLLETGWIRLRGRRRTIGRPVTYGTSRVFLEHFGLEEIGDLPGLSDLKAAGLLDPAVPGSDPAAPPEDDAALQPDEVPLDDEA